MRRIIARRQPARRRPVCRNCGLPIVPVHLHRTRWAVKRNPNSGIMKLCHPKCYGATGKVCSCKCRGLFHGGG